jgi:hypothetical protein
LVTKEKVTKMTKKYYCEKINSNLVQCGETCPEKFTKGRYSKCKKCKNEEIYKLRHDKKSEEIKNQEKQLDPDSNIKWLFLNLIENYPVVENKTVKEALCQSIEEICKINETSQIFTVKKEILNENFERLNSKHKILDKSHSELYNFCNSLEERIKVLENITKSQSDLLAMYQEKISFLEKTNKYDPINELKRKHN